MKGIKVIDVGSNPEETQFGTYVSLVGLSSTLAKYDYCYDTAMAAKYDVSKPDFTEYGLKSEPECNNH